MSEMTGKPVALAPAELAEIAARWKDASPDGPHYWYVDGKAVAFAPIDIARLLEHGAALTAARDEAEARVDQQKAIIAGYADAGVRDRMGISTLSRALRAVEQREAALREALETIVKLGEGMTPGWHQYEAVKAARSALGGPTPEGPTP